MKIGYREIFFLQRLNLVPRGCIILEKTHNFHGFSVNLPENLRKLSVYGKVYHTGNWAKEPAFYAILHFAHDSHYSF